jgi:hypothetical protein
MAEHTPADLLASLRTVLGELEWLAERHKQCKQEPGDDVYAAIAEATETIRRAEGVKV